MPRPVIPGLTPQAERAVGELIDRLEARIAALEGEPAGFEVKRANFTARAGQVITVEPPPAGLTVTLPAASATTRRARVVVTAKNSNPVRWESAGGLVNGVRQVTSNAPGAAEAICDGEAWHVSVGAASATGSSASTTGATYFLENADTGLPNARVADDSSEIDLDYTTPALVSWFIKTASVAFSKLANLAGLSVLGRATNSTGVMAAITATAARQALRANDAGTSLEWGHPVQVSDSGSDIGDFFDLNFVDGTGTFVVASDAGSGRASVQYNWHGLYVFDGGSFVDYFQGLRFDDGTGIVATVTDSSPTGIVRFDWDGTTNLVTGWAGVLAIDAASGANNPQVDVGQHLNFGLAGPATSDPQIRSGDAHFRMRGTSLVSLGGGTGALVFSTTGATEIGADGGTVTLSTTATPRLSIADDGEWIIPLGSSGQVLTHQGANTPPVWASVDLSSVTYTAGDGIDLAANVFSADVSDFAGTGLEDDGSNNLRIAAAAAGAGLTGGGGSALAVGAGDGITVNANDVAVNKAGDFDTVPWSGVHRFTSEHILVGTTFWRNRLDQTLAANADNIDVSGVNMYRVVANGFSLTGMVADNDGQLVLIVNADDVEPLYIINQSGSSTAANRFMCPHALTFVLPPKSGVWARYDTANDRWYLLAPDSPHRLLAVHKIQTADASWSVTPPVGATWFEITQTGGGGGGGGADADTDAEACAGAGGGAGGTAVWYETIASGNITGVNGAGGAGGSNTGGNGTTGGTSSWTYASGTRWGLGSTSGGGGGAGTSTGAGAGTATQMRATIGGTGGSVSSGDLQYFGGDGANGIMYSNGTTEAQAAASGGVGGSSHWGGGGQGARGEAAAATLGGGTSDAPGSGGGGAIRIATGAATGAVGGAGTDGLTVIRFYSGAIPDFATIS